MTTTQAPIRPVHPAPVGAPAGASHPDRGDVAALPVERLEAQLVSLAGQLAAGTYELLVLVGELDARGAYVAWGALSCAAWLAEVCDVEVATARTQVRVARALRNWPALDAAMRNGDVSYAKARVLVPHLTNDNVNISRRARDGHPRRAARRRDRRLGAPPRGPRRHRSPPTRRAVGDVAHRTRRHGHPHRTAATRPSRRALRGDRPASDRHLRARGRVTHPTTRRRARRRGHRRRWSRRRRSRHPRRPDRQHPHRRHPTQRPRRGRAAA